jgi:hypothetical protein
MASPETQPFKLAVQPVLGDMSSKLPTPPSSPVNQKMTSFLPTTEEMPAGRPGPIPLITATSSSSSSGGTSKTSHASSTSHQAAAPAASGSPAAAAAKELMVAKEEAAKNAWCKRFDDAQPSGKGLSAQDPEFRRLFDDFHKAQAEREKSMKEAGLLNPEGTIIVEETTGKRATMKKLLKRFGGKSNA